MLTLKKCLDAMTLEDLNATLGDDHDAVDAQGDPAEVLLETLLLSLVATLAISAAYALKLAVEKQRRPSLFRQ